MDYVIIEGARNKSEDAFYRTLFTHTSLEKITFINCDGNWNILKIFKEYLVNKLVPGDFVYLLFDSVDSIGNLILPDFLNACKKVCENKQCIFYYSNYYCFEEIFLSYAHIDALFNQEKSELITMWKELREYLVHGKGQEYYESTMPDYVSQWQEILPHGANLSSREHFAASILSYLLTMAFHSFMISKSFIGSCWLFDCSKARQNNYICQKCNYLMKDSIFKDKYMDLNENSILKKETIAIIIKDLLQSDFNKHQLKYELSYKYHAEKDNSLAEPEVWKWNNDMNWCTVKMIHAAYYKI